MTAEPFADRLIAAQGRKRSYLVVGLDPDLAQMPPELLDGVDDLASAAAAVERFCIALLDGVSGVVAAVKPQSAFFEQYGSAGLAALERVIAHARAAGLLVIEDAKRGDIGTTMAAYAAASLGRVTVGGLSLAVHDSDAVTLSPYLGPESLQPMLDAADAHGKGVFVLVRTSNPGSGAFQALEADGVPLFERVAAAVDALGAGRVGSSGYSSVGAVTGLTYPEDAPRLRTAMPRAVLLVPGFGAQGGSADDFPAFLGEDGLGAIAASSRAIASGWKGAGDGAALARVRDGAGQAARAAGQDLRAAVEAAGRWPW